MASEPDAIAGRKTGASSVSDPARAALHHRCAESQNPLQNRLRFRPGGVVTSHGFRYPTASVRTRWSMSFRTARQGLIGHCHTLSSSSKLRGQYAIAESGSGVELGTKSAACGCRMPPGRKPRGRPVQDQAPPPKLPFAASLGRWPRAHSPLGDLISGGGERPVSRGSSVQYWDSVCPPARWSL